jgi:hypothetical protein
MRKSLTALATAGTIAVATIATPNTADARWGWWGPAFGGLVVGAIIGAALSRPYYGYPSYGYGYGYGYGYAPAYYGYAPAYYGYAPAYYGGYYAPRPYYRYYARRYYRRW